MFQYASHERMKINCKKKKKSSSYGVHFIFSIFDINFFRTSQCNNLTRWSIFLGCQSQCCTMMTRTEKGLRTAWASSRMIIHCSCTATENWRRKPSSCSKYPADRAMRPSLRPLPTWMCPFTSEVLLPGA